MPPETLDPNLIRTLLLCLKKFSDVDAEMPIQTAMAFLHVCLREGITVTEVAGELKMAQSSASRNIAALAHINRHHEAGHELVSIDENPQDRRQRNLSLTPDGKRLALSLTHLLS